MSYLHCLQTKKGGIQVAFETPDREELGRIKEIMWNSSNFRFSEEFLEVADNLTSTAPLEKTPETQLFGGEIFFTKKNILFAYIF